MNSSRPSSAWTARLPRWGLLLAVLVVLAVLLSGCGGGVPILAYPPNQLPNLEQAMARIEAQSVNEENMTQGQIKALHTQLGFGTEQLNSAKVYTSARARFLQGYWYENGKDYATAQRIYTEVERTNTPYAAQALYRAGVLGMRGVLGTQSYNTAKNSFRMLVSKRDNPGILDRLLSGAQPQQFRVLVRTVPGQTLPGLAGEGGVATIGTGSGPTFVPQPMSDTALNDLDTLYRTSTGIDRYYYVTVKGIVDAFRAISPSYGPALALIFLALLVKVLTIPLTTKAFRGMRDMQRIQPILKELQDKYKDDRAKLAEEQMRVYKEHNVSMTGGCLPMLIQLPIFIIVYNAVIVYSNGFAGAKFLWINSLALPDTVLLILYLISMIFSQKLTPTTASPDPAVQQQQKIMTWFMPVFLVVFLKDFASAFVLYWLFLNIFTTIHQYYLMRQFRAEEVAAGIVPAGAVAESAKPNDAQVTPAPPNSPKKGKRR